MLPLTPRFLNHTWYPADPAGPTPPLPFEGFVAVTQDAVEYPPGVTRTKNVLDLIAMNEDNGEPDVCGNCAPFAQCPTCHKMVTSSGAIQTADLYASARYDVLAKVPAASGLVWSIAYVCGCGSRAGASWLRAVRLTHPACVAAASPACTTAKSTSRHRRAPTTRAIATGTEGLTRIYHQRLRSLGALAAAA